MKFAIKVNRPETVKGQQIYNWRSEYLIGIESDGNSCLYSYADFKSNPSAVPLAVAEGLVSYDMRSDVYLRANRDQKTIEISRDFVLWSPWRPLPHKLLDSNYIYSSLSIRFQAFYDKTTQTLELYEAPNWMHAVKLHVPDPETILGIQILDHDYSTFYRDPQPFEFYPLMPEGGKYHLPDEFQWLPPVDNKSDLPTAGNTDGDARRVITEDKAYTWLARRSGWLLKEYPIDMPNGWDTHPWFAGLNELHDPDYVNPPKRILEFCELDGTHDFATELCGYRIEGGVKPKESGSYTFTATYRGPTRIWVNGVLKIDYWVDHEDFTISTEDFNNPSQSFDLPPDPLESIEEQTETFTLSLDEDTFADIEIQYYQITQERTFRLEWESSEIPLEPIPSESTGIPSEPQWVPYLAAVFCNLTDDGSVHPVARAAIIFYYPDRTTLTYLDTTVANTTVLPRIRYFDFLFPTPFCQTQLLQGQLYTKADISDEGEELNPTELTLAKLALARPVKTAYGPEILFHKDSAIYNIPKFTGFWSHGVKSLVPVDYITGKSVLYKTIVAPYFQCVGNYVFHTEVFTGDGIRLSRHQSHHLHTENQIWEEARFHQEGFDDQGIVFEEDYVDEIFLIPGERKNVKRL